MTPMEFKARQVTAKKRQEARSHLSVFNMGNVPARMLLNEDAFASMLYLERRRAERAQNHFVLVLVDIRKIVEGKQRERMIRGLTWALTEATRETDIIGWYLENDLMGVIGTALNGASKKIIEARFYSKLCHSFAAALGIERSSSIKISFHFFPEDYHDREYNLSVNMALYPEINKRDNANRVSQAVKRCIDVIGSGAALVLLSPLFAAIALGIKITSKGPILFKQKRLGQGGKSITVLKFRSMRTDCDAKIHKQYVEKFIAGQTEGANEKGSKPLFKIQNDPRITPIGHFIRKTSLDELPQFWNVLRGDMSLVGPRPAIAYEFRAYKQWHRRRVLEIKPGITGLWQVEGRSRIRFDEMVRLDLKYARIWSIWLDLKILLRTPAAVFSGDGAQ